VVPTDSYGISRAPHYSGALIGGSTDFAYGTVTLCGRPFHAGSTIRELCNSLAKRQLDPSGPTTPQWQRLPAITPLRFRLFPVRSPLLGESLLFSLPRGTEMFHFPRFPLPVLCVQTGMARHDPYQVVLFGNPRLNACLAANRGLSQPATSFIGFQRLGIHRVPFYTCRDDARARYRVLNDPTIFPTSACADQPNGPSCAVRLGNPSAPRTGKAQLATFKAAQCAQRRPSTRTDWS
jgi:hypothetical protein